MRCLLFLLLLSQKLFAQYPLGEPSLPNSSAFQPVLPTGQYPSLPRIQQFLPPVQMGANADYINQRQQQTTGPRYTGNDPIANQRATEIWLQERMMRDPAYNPALRNPNSEQQIISPNEEVLKLVREAGAQENSATSVSRLKSGYYKSAPFIQDTKPFTDALQTLKNMLNGKQRMSLTEAFFVVENAYGNCYLTRVEYANEIERSKAFIHSWMREKNLKLDNQADIHLAIQKFIADTLSIKTLAASGNRFSQSPAVSIHFPFFYDYDDYSGEKDFRNYFVTKCLATGSGQCSSMPVLYLILAEQLGAAAYLTTAPQHSFIKYPDSAGHLVNYEPTSNWRISDKWYQDNMAISPAAIRSGLYLDTFNKRQLIADCILRLGSGYLNKYGSADGNFMARCVEAAKPQFSKPNLLLLSLHSAQLSRMLQAVAHDAGLRSFNDLGQSPHALELFDAITENENYLKQTGYTEQPPQLYNGLIQEQEFKGRLQAAKEQNGKERRSLFTTNP